jgi:hypothetical protein
MTLKRTVDLESVTSLNLQGKTTHLVAWRHSSATSVQMAGTDIQVLKARTQAGELNILQ